MVAARSAEEARAEAARRFDRPEEGVSVRRASPAEVMLVEGLMAAAGVPGASRVLEVGAGGVPGPEVQGELFPAA